jgi:hypothetical protein
MANMSNGSQNGIWKALFGMPRFAPAWFAAFLGGLLLLFINELPPKCATYMVPSLVVYSLGAAILGTIHRLLGITYASNAARNNESPIPLRWRIVIFALHSICFIGLVVYNAWRGAL